MAYDEVDRSERATGSDAAKDDIVKEALEVFGRCQEVEQDLRTEGLVDLKFSLGDQWPEAIRLKRDKEKRPLLTINRLPAFIRQVVNDARQNRPAIYCHPADSNADPHTAQLLNGLIRQIEAASKAGIAYDTAIDCAVRMGIGYFRINTAYACDDRWEMDIVIQRIVNPFSVWGDPDSTSATSDDWKTCFVADMLSKKEFDRQYKGAAPGGGFDFASAGYDGLAGDWRVGDKVRVAEYWKRTEVDKKVLLLSDHTVVEPQVYIDQRGLYERMGIAVENAQTVKSYNVKQYMLTGIEVLEERDWLGHYIPIIPVYGEEVWCEGRRNLRSLVRDARDPQRMLNYMRTTSAEVTALAPKVPYIGPKGSFTYDQDKWDTSTTDTHAYIEYDGPVAPERQMLDAGPAAGAIAEATNADADLKAVIGIHEAGLGMPGNETSGRAILMRNKEGDVSTFHFVDNQHRAVEHGGVVIVDLIPHFYDEGRIIRVLGPEGPQPTPPVAVPLGVATPRLGPDMKPVKVPQVGPDGAPLVDSVTHEPIMAEVDHIYDLTVGKYDVVVKAGPSYTTRREEAAGQMLEMLRSSPEIAPLIGDLVAKNLDWPGAEEIARRLEAMLPPQAKGENPAMKALQDQLNQTQAAAAQQAQEAEHQAQLSEAAVADMQVRLDQEKQRTAIEARKLDQADKELEIKQFEAETDRIKAQAALADKAGGMSEEQAAEIAANTVELVLDSPEFFTRMRSGLGLPHPPMDDEMMEGGQADDELAEGEPPLSESPLTAPGGPPMPPGEPPEAPPIAPEMGDYPGEPEPQG